MSKYWFYEKHLKKRFFFESVIKELFHLFARFLVMKQVRNIYKGYSCLVCLKTVNARYANCLHYFLHVHSFATLVSETVDRTESNCVVPSASNPP